MRWLAVLAVILSVGCGTDPKAARCAELSRQYEAALNAPLPAAPGAATGNPGFWAYQTATAQRDNHISTTRAAYERECLR
ncbi:MAG TPA: hypothetical protein VEI97_00750 [bacterium]|nr:hypothetical protein [bacterium]